MVREERGRTSRGRGRSQGDFLQLRNQSRVRQAGSVVNMWKKGWKENSDNCVRACRWRGIVTFAPRFTVARTGKVHNSLQPLVARAATKALVPLVLESAVLKSSP